MNKNPTFEYLKQHDISVESLKEENHPSYRKNIEKLSELHRKGHITEPHMIAIAEIAPQLVDLIIRVTETASKSQSEGFQAQSSTAQSGFKAQETIANEAITDEVRCHISDNIRKMNEDNNETQRSMNKNNNAMFKKVIISVVTIVVGGITSYIYGRKQS